MLRRAKALPIASAAVLLLAAACGQAKAGTALPNGDDAAAYVSSKFKAAMEKLTDKLGNERDITMSDDDYFKIDEKWVHQSINSARFGNPESYITRNQSLKNPDESIDSFTPGSGSVEYQHLGPAYKTLEPTPWVSMPKSSGGKPTCELFGGILRACQMVGAVQLAMNADSKAIKKAESLPNGQFQLQADVTLDAFLRSDVEKLPPDLLARVTDGMRQAVIPTTVTINQDGTLSAVSMVGTVDKDGHHIEVNDNFSFGRKATAQDFPQIPDSSQVTVLPDQAAVNDFNTRLANFQGGGG
jgi:hypothetical protein